MRSLALTNPINWSDTLPHKLINWSDTPHVRLACAPPTCALCVHPPCVPCTCTPMCSLCVHPPHAHSTFTPPHMHCACTPHTCPVHAPPMHALCMHPMRALPVFDWLSVPTTANQIGIAHAPPTCALCVHPPPTYALCMHPPHAPCQFLGGLSLHLNHLTA